MAIYHLSLKTAARNEGGKAGEHALYIARQGRYAKPESISQQEYEYISREGQYSCRVNELVHVEHGNMPGWAVDQEVKFWRAADKHERANGRLYTELEFALPRELHLDQQLRLARQFQQQMLGDRHPFTMAVHNTLASDGLAQPHVHLMFTERRLDGIDRSPELFFKRANSKVPQKGGTKKDRDWSRKDKVEEVRYAWEQAANSALQKHGFSIRVDRRTLEAQGIEREPEPKLGPYRNKLLQRGIHSKDGITKKVVELRKIKQQQSSEQKRSLTPHSPELQQNILHTSPPAEICWIPADQVRSQIEKRIACLEARLSQTRELRNQLGYGAVESPDAVKAQAEQMAREEVGGARWAWAEAQLRSASEALEEAIIQRKILQEQKTAQGSMALLPWKALTLAAESFKVEQQYKTAQLDYLSAREDYNLTLDWLALPKQQQAVSRYAATLIAQHAQRQRDKSDMTQRCQHMQARIENERLYSLSLEGFGKEKLAFSQNTDGHWMPAMPRQFIERFVENKRRECSLKNQQQKCRSTTSLTRSKERSKTLS